VKLLVLAYCTLVRTFIASVKEVMFVILSVCLCVRRITQKIVDEIYGVVGCVAVTSRLNFGVNPDRNADTGIFKRNFLPVRDRRGQFNQLLTQ